MATINGTAGNDTLPGTPQDDLFDGLSGFDTAQVAADSAEATFSLDAQGRWVVSSPQGSDTLDSTEAVQLADGTVGVEQQEFRVNTATALDQTQPVLTALADGSFLVTWVAGKEVHGQRFDPDGVPAGDEFTVPTLGAPSPWSQHHDTVALADGGYLIAQMTAVLVRDRDRYNMSPYLSLLPVIEVLRFDSNGAFVRAWDVARGEESRDRGTRVSDPSLTALSDGNFLVTWHSEYFTMQGGYSSRSVSRRLDSSGTPLSGEEPSPRLPEGAALPGGGYALASDESGDITVQHFDSTGAPVGDPTHIGTGFAPSTTALSEGGYVVIWNVQADDGRDVYAQRFDSTGARLDAAVRVNTTPGSVTAQPTVTALEGGGYVVAWTSQEAGASDTDIHARRFDSSGAPVPIGHTLQGDANANTLHFSGSQAVRLLGGSGDDVLQGGSGDDLLDGGTGSDTAVSADLHSSISWQLPTDHVLRMTGTQSGNDALLSVEQVHVRGARIGIEFDWNSEVLLAVSDWGVALRAPRVALLLDGSSVVVWERHGDDADAGLYAQRFDPNWVAAGAPLQIKENGKMVVAALADGGYVLVWSLSTSWANNSSAIDAQRFDASGAAVGSTVRVTTTDPGNARDAEPMVAGLADGGYAVAWTKAAYLNDSGIFTRQFDGSGLPVTPETRVNTTQGSYPGEQSIAPLSNGGYVVTWTMGEPETWPNDPGYDIYAQRFDSNGTAAGSQTRVNSTTTGQQVRSDVTALVDGGYLVSWMSGTAIQAQRFDATGAPVGAETWVNPSSPQRDGAGPVVAALADGGYVVAWASGDGSGSTNNSASNSGITAQRFDATDARVGTEFGLNTTTAGSGIPPVLTALDDGGYMVTWVTYQNGGNSIETQRFDANNLREGHLTLTGGAEDNVLRVTSSPEGVELIGAGGADTLAGAGGWDVLRGGPGGDTFELAASGNGVDTVTDWGAGDRLSIAGASFAGAVTAGNGQAVALNEVQASTRAGVTTLHIGTDATPGADVVVRLTGSFAADSFSLQDNRIEAPTGRIVTGRGPLVGGPGDDTLIAEHGVTCMEGGAGNDTYVLGNPNDRLIEQAGGGIDEVQSKWSHTLGKHFERLVLTGERPARGTGNDLDNVITGNAARNVLIGGLGADMLGGGGGADLFVYRSVSDSSAAPGARDRLLDFSRLEGDRIDLRGIDANPDRPGKQGFSFIGTAEFSRTDATGQLRFDGAAHLLYASIDADSQAEMVIEVTGVSAMSAQDFAL